LKSAVPDPSFVQAWGSPPRIFVYVIATEAAAVNKENSVMNEKIDPVRKTDDEAFELTRTLLENTKYASLGVNDTSSGFPLVSRVAASFSKSTGLFFAGSDLSLHSKCLLEDNKCSLMLGEPGKGDGLAYARITFVGRAARMRNDHERRAEYREVFIKTHPKAELYIDFLDFGFYPIELELAYLNGGFGKAYHLDKDDMSILVG
jgi:putative heme iron utilization protein